ncbi:hypothetical protein BV25DRAFT_1786018, partial [Artomyces pyxidatus]
LEEEEIAVQHVLSSIRTRQNSLAPVSSLPSEVLAIVFKFAYEHASSRENLSLLGWIEATYVCRRWRQVALDHLSLWGHISLHASPAWIEVMLARSQSSPIFI